MLLLLYSKNFKHGQIDDVQVGDNNDYELITIDQKNNSNVANSDGNLGFIASVLHMRRHVYTRKLQIKLNQLQLSINS